MSRSLGFIGSFNRFNEGGMPSLRPIWERTSVADNSLITAEQVSEHLKYPDTCPEIDLFIEAATLDIENYLEISLRESEWTGQLRLKEHERHFFFDKFEVRIDRRPLNSIVSVAVNGEVLDPTQYNLFPANQQTACLEIDSSDDLESLDIVVNAGFTADNLPKNIQLALLQTVASIDQNRGDCECECAGDLIPKIAKNLLGQHKFISLCAA